MDQGRREQSGKHGEGQREGRGRASGFLEAEGSASCLRFALRGEQMTTT